MNNLINCLQKIEKLLKENKKPQAEVIRKVIESKTTDRELFLSLLLGGDIWGGSGSVVDLYLNSKEEDIQLKNYIIELVKEMEINGIFYERAKEIAVALEKFILRSGVGVSAKE
ncbi:hypothetical protein HZA38_00230 [Candidatus Peregrinibacteria bacterium]|nr:hypothetical protein [Candidatus Peregrinibacteria bacterium]